MSDINDLVIEGNLTREPELKPAGSKTVINFSIAHNTRTKDTAGNWVDGTPMYFDVEFWPNDPQYWAKRLTKGTAVLVIGALKQESWEKDGQKYSRVRIRAQDICAKWLPEITGTASTAPTASAPPLPQQNDGGFPSDIPF